MPGQRPMLLEPAPGFPQVRRFPHPRAFVLVQLLDPGGKLLRCDAPAAGIPGPARGLSQLSIDGTAFIAGKRIHDSWYPVPDDILPRLQNFNPTGNAVLSTIAAAIPVCYAVLFSGGAPQAGMA